MKKNKLKSKQKTTTISKENLVLESDGDDESNFAYDNNTKTITEVEVYSNERNTTEDKNYVMQKFLRDESLESNNKSSRKERATRTNVQTFNEDIENVDDVDARSDISQISNATYDASPTVVQQRNLNKSGQNKNENIEMKTFLYVENEKSPAVKKKHKRKDLIDKIDVDKKVITKKQVKKQAENEVISKETDIIVDENDNVDSKLKLEALPKRNHEDNTNVINEEVLALQIVKTDKLLLNSYVLNASVRVHLIDIETNEYVKKSDSQRCVNIHNADKDKHIDYINYFTTKVYKLINYSQLYPVWNETIIINENFPYLKNHNTMIFFFELLESSNLQTNDSSSMALAPIVAWAFLKPQNNYNKDLRLQLFYPQSIIDGSKCNSYNWWQKKKMTKYPSTLYVKLKETNVCHNVLTLLAKQKKPDGKRSGKQDGTTEFKELITNEEESVDVDLKLPKFDQLYKIPDHKLFEIPVGDGGCLTHKFSRNGVYLAIATCEDDDYIIIIYELNNQTELCRLYHHQGLIYDLAWSRDHRQLISASADCTIAIWDVAMQKLELVLSHPSYVYCCVYCDDKFIATGCFDHRIRIWSLTSYTLLNELKEHKGYVTTICFSKENNFMYSADSTGCILKWQKEQKTWHLIQNISILDLKDVIINQIILHRREKRLIVNSRDGQIRLVDIKTGYVLTSFTKGTNEKANLKCSITPCNSYLLSGTEAGDVYVWQIDNGKVQQVFSPYHEHIVLHCVQFDAVNNLIAVSHFGACKPIIIYGLKATVKDPLVNPTNKLQNIISFNRKQNLAKVEKGTNFRMILEKFDKMNIKE